MAETIEEAVGEGKASFDKAMEHLRDEFSKIRAGKASPAMLNGIKANYYDVPTLLSSVANISTPDSRTIALQPWEKNMLGPIEQAIFQANLGLTPMNDGEFIRISIPPLTEERRKDLVKTCKGLAEDAKVSLRNGRHKMIDFVKKEVKAGYPEDAGKKKETMIDGMVKDYTTKIEAILEAKERDIMKV